ncbi:MAG: enoyl-CoA hydratase/isomerase family protein [Firmicutes bacterium]|nr:enoyl-CoA hydratase/isomerase family protein [Bacillota bacterium]
MTFETILYDVADQIATITLHRPENMNTYNNQMCAEINQALDLADNDPNVRAVIFTGGGGTKKPVYCAGFDLTGGKPFDFSAEDIHETRDTGGMNALRIYAMKKPVIGAINGAAVGIGATMTLPMDVRILSENAKLGFVFAKRGFVNEACSSWFLPRIVGVSKAVELVMTGRIITAQQAYEIGLATEVVPEGKAYERAVEIAKEIAVNCAPVSVALCRQMIYQMAGARWPMTAHKLESVSYHYIGVSPDALEGAASFLEKRPPEWKMDPAKDMPPEYPWFTPAQFPKNVQE